MGKIEWQSMTTSAKKKFFRSNSGSMEIPKTHTASSSSTQTQNSVKSNGAKSNTTSQETLRKVEYDSDPDMVVPLSSENLVLPSVSAGSLGSGLPMEEETETETNSTDSFTQSVGDRKRTLMRYTAAVDELKAALRLRRPGWETFEFPDFDVLPENVTNLALLQEAIDEKLSSCHGLSDKGIWQKGKLIAERLFVALSPFAKSFLTVAKEASQTVRVIWMC
jgi:hypothetical protein